ncbi:hypothetical protein [Alkalimarinus coralli]|uniref:hypothetical protein n=1 Tax=Alkalimarinus coralli TaxID=2935863 RepID=UPI00202AE1AC|nr:hypothetical protein [Alkalimarinus coralli]
MAIRTPHTTPSIFDSLTDHELMLLQEMCGRNFDYDDESRELLDAFIRMDEALMARGFKAESLKERDTKSHKAA